MILTNLDIIHPYHGHKNFAQTLKLPILTNIFKKILLYIFKGETNISRLLKFCVLLGNKDLDQDLF